MRQIKSLRKKIDAVDEGIISLLVERGKLAGKIGEIKKSRAAEYYVPSREKEVLMRLRGKNVKPFTREAVENVFREIFNATRAVESKLSVSYFGPEATFTHQAALKNFGVNARYIPADTIAGVFEEVEKSRAAYGVIPVENTSEGMVNHTLDMFFDSDLKIAAEINLPIEHCLLSKASSIKSVRAVYSHHQALAQTRNWLARNLPRARLVETLSTSHAAKIASHKRAAAAVAGMAAAKIYALNVLARGIEDSKTNYTRFLIIGRSLSSPSGSDKTSVMVSIKDRVGALHDILLAFRKHGINLTKIESRPSKKKAWDYVFFIDFLGHVNDLKVKKALAAVERSARSVKILGSYPRAE